MASDKKYKIISIRQPQAWAVCVGEKTVENKPKSTSYRGLLLVHAGKNKDGLRGLDDLRGWGAYERYFDLGAIIGAVDLYDAVEFNRSLEVNLHANGPCCYLLRNPKWFNEPIPCTGQLGIFNLPEHLVAKVEDQLNKSGRTIQMPDELLQAIRPLPSDACCYQGQYYLDHDLFQDALRRFDGAINLDTANSNAYYGRSLAHDSQDMMDEAISDISAAIALEGDNSEYYYQRGYYYWSSDRIAESIQDYSTAIDLDPNLEMAYLMRSVSYHLSKEDVKAIADANRVQVMNQGNLLAKLIKGGILLDSGKYEDGFDELRVAEEQFADHPAPSYLLYWGYTKSGKSELARAAFNRFVAKEGDEEEMKQYMHDWGFTF